MFSLFQSLSGQKSYDILRLYRDHGRSRFVQGARRMFTEEIFRKICFQTLISQRIQAFPLQLLQFDHHHHLYLYILDVKPFRIHEKARLLVQVNIIYQICIP